MKTAPMMPWDLPWTSTDELVAGVEDAYAWREGLVAAGAGKLGLRPAVFERMLRGVDDQIAELRASVADLGLVELEVGVVGEGCVSDGDGYCGKHADGDPACEVTARMDDDDVSIEGSWSEFL